MRVVLDVTLLGLIEQWQNARSGIFRVIEQTALGLKGDSRIDLRLSAAESWWNYQKTRQYLNTSSDLAASLLIPNGFVTNALVAAQLRSDKEIVGSRWTTMGQRLLRRVSQGLTRRVSPLPESALRGNDVFHSTFTKIPVSTRGVSKLRTFITIYDLIPILFSETMPQQALRTFEAMLRSIRPDVHCLCISEATKADLCNHIVVDPKKLTVIPLAASEELFFPVRNPDRIEEAKAAVGIPIGSRYLLSVNTLQPLKNMTRAISAFASFVEQTQTKDVYFVLVGARGWNYEQILDTVAKCNLAAGRVIVAGYVPDEYLAPLYSGALAFIYPSLYEGFGLPPLEAMQCGTPVITGNSSSFPEVVGAAGVMVEPTDENALSQAMLDICTNERLRSALIEAGLKRARDFSWTRYHRELVEAYSSDA